MATVMIGDMDHRTQSVLSLQSAMQMATGASVKISSALVLDEGRHQNQELIDIRGKLDTLADRLDAIVIERANEILKPQEVPHAE